MQTTYQFIRVRIPRSALSLRSMKKGSETVFSKLFVEGFNGRILKSFGAGLYFLLLEFIILGGFGLSLVLELRHDVLLGPASRLSEISKTAEVSVSFHSENLKGIWDNHSLFLVVWVWHALEDFQTSHSGGTSGGLVWNHTAEDLPEDARWGLPVGGSSTWVCVASLVHLLLSLQLASEQGSRLKNGLTSDNNDFLAIEELLSDNAGKTSQQVISTVNDNLFFEHA